jgi:hypothetical protein
MKYRRRSNIVSPGIGQRLLGRHAHLGLLLCGQRLTRRPARAAVPADHVHRQLDGLDELGLGVPAQQRVQQPVQRPGLIQVSGHASPVQLDTAAREGVGVPGHPAPGSGDGELQDRIVGADQHVETGREFGDRVGATGVTGELLDPGDQALVKQRRQQRGRQVDLRVDRADSRAP